MAYDKQLADRIREALAAQLAVREVRMFGGLSFMVNGRMVVGVMSDGALLVHANPERADELLSAQGVRPAEMGAGRAMGKGWIAVDEGAIAAQEDFDFWIGVAMEYNGMEAGTRSRSRQ